MYYKIFNVNIKICMNNMAVMRKISSVYLTFIVVNDYRTSLNEMAIHSYLELIGFWCHLNFPKNPAAYALAKRHRENESTGWCTNVILHIYDYANYEQYGNTRSHMEIQDTMSGKIQIS